MGVIANLLVRIGAVTDDLTSGLNRATRDVQKMGRDMEAVGKRLTLAVSLPIAGIGIASLKAAGEMEQLQVAFTTMTKSADVARNHIEDLKKFALETPFNVREVAQASRLMQAYGFALNDVIPRLRTIGNAVAALGGGTELLERVVRSMGEIGTRGKITGEQLRELSRAGIPALDALAQKLGISVAETQKRVTAGMVDAKTATEALLTYMETRFAGGMEAQSRTLIGLWQRFKEALFLASAEIGSNLAPTAKRLMNEALLPMLDQVKALTKGFTEMGPAAQKAVLGLGTVLVTGPAIIWILGSLTTNAIALTKGITGLIGVLSPFLLNLGAANFALKNGLTAALTAAEAKSLGLAVALRALPFIGLAAGIGLVLGKLNEFATNTNTTDEALKNLKKNHPDFFGANAASHPGNPSIAPRVAPGNLSAITNFIKGLGGARQEVKLTDEQIKKLGETQNRHLDALEEMGKRYETFWRDVDRIYKDLISNDEELARSYLYGKAVFAATHEQMVRKAQEAVAIIVPLYERMGEALFRAVNGAQSTATAYGVGQYSGAAKRQAEIAMAGWPETLKAAQKEMNEFQRDAHRAWNQMTNSIARNIVEWKGWKDTVINVGKDFAQGFLSIMMKQLLQPLEDQFAKLAAKIGGWLTGVLGGGGGAVGVAANGGASTAGGIANGGGGVAGGIGSSASGVMGAVNMVSGVVGAVSSVIGNFQMAGMNKTLDLLEHSMRFLEINFAAFYQTALTYLPYLETIHGAIYEHVLPAMAEMIGGQGGARFEFNNCTFGSVSQSEIDRMMNASLTRARAQGYAV
jgi:tape measure domain-containing protein